MRRTVAFKTKEPKRTKIFFMDSGYDDIIEQDNGIAVCLKADGFQEMKMLMDELMCVAKKAGAQFLGYIG